MADIPVCDSDLVWPAADDAVCDASRRGVVCHFIKRTTDITISLVVLLLSWPLILGIAVYILRRSRGQIIFRQIRIKRNRRRVRSIAEGYYIDPNAGKLMHDRRCEKNPFQLHETDRRVREACRKYRDPRNGEFADDRRKKDLLGQPFVFYKFATMYSDAKQRFPELYAYQYSPRDIQKIRFKTDNDPRVPKWATWLRRSSLDELPNLVNVLKGDMSLVGPRPDIPEMVQYYTPEQQAKLSVKPGVTGLAQIRGRGELSFQDTLEYDLEYVRKWLPRMDLLLLFETFIKLFTGSKGAY